MKQFSGIILLQLCCLSVELAQAHQFVRDEGIRSDLQKANVGNIVFTLSPVLPDAYKKSDLLHSFSLTDSCDLNIAVFMEQSLTNYLHSLAPQLSAEELTNIGNYQFTFYTDGRLIYKENLNPHAGLAVNKNTKTVFGAPLLSTANEDSWGTIFMEPVYDKRWRRCLN